MHDKFINWINEEDSKGTSRLTRCTGFLQKSEKELVLASMELAFLSGYIRGSEDPNTPAQISKVLND